MMTLLVRCCLLFLSLATIAACGDGVSNNVTFVSSPPAVVSTFPANGATGVPLDTTISVTFNQAMDPATITSSTFILSSGNIVAPGNVIVSPDGTTATLTISTGSLSPNITYTARITTGVRNASGTPLGAEFTWTFTTGTQTVQSTEPQVVSTAPAANAAGVDVATVVSATFNRVMDPATGNSQTFTVSSAQGAVAGTIAVNGAIATFTPAVALTPNTVYTATITTGFRDIAGIALATNFSWSFTTAQIAGTTPPVVTASVPAIGATGVPLDQLVSATFNKDMNPQTISNATFTLHSGGVPVAGAVTLSGQTATFRPATPLNANTTYTATITTGAKDLAGNPLASPFTWSFTTGTSSDTSPPTVVATVPANGASNLPRTGTTITATFSKAMNPATVNQFNFTLSGNGVPVQGVVTLDGTGIVATFTPIAPLVANTLHTATITTGARDLAGNPLASPFVWSFTTGTM